MKERLSWDDIVRLYPNQWVILDEADVAGSTVLSGIVVQNCDDDSIDDAYMATVLGGHHYLKERTSDLPYVGVINGANFRVALE